MEYGLAGKLGARPDSHQRQHQYAGSLPFAETSTDTTCRYPAALVALHLIKAGEDCGYFSAAIAASSVGESRWSSYHVCHEVRRSISDY
jgi:hypothetical protein